MQDTCSRYLNNCGKHYIIPFLPRNCNYDTSGVIARVQPAFRLLSRLLLIADQKYLKLSFTVLPTVGR